MTIATASFALDAIWPLREKVRHFDLGCLLSCAAIDAVAPAGPGELGLCHAGCFECDLGNGSLIWSGGVYDIFGLPRGAQISRDEAVGFYAEASRAKLERLRTQALGERRGFTLDVEIRPAAGTSRWMRIIAAPVLERGRPTRLHGLKLIV